MNLQSDNQKQLVARIETALTNLKYKPAEIAVILAQLEMSIQEEIGQDLLSTLPPETQQEITAIIENKGDMNRLASLVPKVSKEEMITKIEEKMQKTAEIFEQGVVDAATATAKIQELMQQQPTS